MSTNKKRGFTLVEIIVAITLIILISSTSLLIFNKKEPSEANELFTAANVYLESNDFYKKAIAQNNEVYFWANELIEAGLIDEKQHKDKIGKCLKLSYDDNHVINVAYEESNPDICNITPDLNKEPILEVQFKEQPTLIANNKCYTNDNLKLNIKFDLKGNDFNNIKITYKENSTDKSQTISNINYFTTNGNIYNYEYTIIDGAKDIKVELDTNYSTDTIKSETFIKETDYPNGLYKDKYNNNNNLLNLENNTLKLYTGQKNSINNYTYTLQNGSTQNTNDITALNNNINNITKINITDYCEHSQKFNISKNQTYKYKDYYYLFEDSYDTNDYYYVFNNGNILYSYSDSSRNSNYTSTTLYIYNPLTNERIEVDSASEHSSTIDSTRGISIKVKKENNNYIIYSHSSYSLSSGTTKTYYEKFRYNPTSNNIETIYSAYKYFEGNAIGSNKGNYCEVKYYYQFLVPTKERKGYNSFDDKKVTVGSSLSDSNCLGSIYNRNDTDSPELWDDYVEEYDNVTGIASDYNKNVNTNDDKLMNLIGQCSTIKNLTSVNRCEGTYNNSSYLNSLIRNQMWENTNYIVTPFYAKPDANKYKSTAFIRIEKSNEFTLERDNS